MAPSLRSVGAAALACVGSVSAKQWHLADTYDTTNFFDKFTFFSDADPNSGHVVYQTKAKATELGLAKYEDNEVYLGPDNTNVLDSNTGRPSVRLQSASSYNHGLFIARFSHLPESACGAWPAFWSVGSTWPDDGEIDIIEGWNLQTTNAPAFHTGDSDDFGTCKLDGTSQTATVSTSNCDNTYSDDSQSLNQGCTATDSSAPYGASDGGVYALEWTDTYIKLFAWKWSDVPDNIDSSDPNTDSWGDANMYLKNSDCNIDNHFIDQTLIINLAFCGNPVGNADKWATCKEQTGYDTCSEYVSAKPTAFANTYFKIQDIRYFKTTKSASTSTASTTPALSTSTTYANISIPATGVPTGTPSVDMTTSVVYTTQLHTVTACPSTVTDCPVGSVVTKTVALYTTVCPVSGQESAPTATSGSGSSGSGSSGSGSSGSDSGSDSSPETITETLTKVHTITSCAPTVTNCPARHSTEYITTTYCPGNGGSSGSSPDVTATPGAGSGSGSGSDSSSGSASTGFWPAPAPSGSGSGSGSGYQTPGAGFTPIPTPSIATPATPAPSAASSDSGAGASSVVYTIVPVATPATTPAAGATTGSSSGSTSSSVPVTGSATKMGASFGLLVAAAFAMMI